MLCVGALLYGFTEWLRISGPGSVLGEGGPVELAQLGLLGASGVCLWRSASRPEIRPVVIPLLSVLIAAFTRELDGPLDRVVHGVWKYPAWGAVIVGASYVVTHIDEVRSSVRGLVGCRAVGLCAAALFIVLVESRILGRQDVWSAALGASYVRDVPRLIEELSELAGYGLLLMGCAELGQATGDDTPARCV
ncbi:MAG: hypothetical protein AAFR54_17360 [Planctomycetota bacterium]